MNKRKKTKSDDEMTPAKKKYAEEHELHCEKSIPTVLRSRCPRFVKFSKNSMMPEELPGRLLTEYAIGCRSRDTTSPYPILFFSEEDERLAKEERSGMNCGNALSNHMEYVDAANLVNWGYPDGYTVMLLPHDLFDHMDVPFAINRGNGDLEFADVVFAMPDMRTVVGSVAMSSTCDTSEIVVAHDRISGCIIPPPYGHMTLRDIEYKRRYSELHIMAKFSVPCNIPGIVATRSKTLLLHPLEATYVDHATDATSYVAHPPNMRFSGCSRECGFMTLSDFVSNARERKAIGLMAIVISHPDHLLSQQMTTKAILGELRRWRSNSVAKMEQRQSSKEEMIGRMFCDTIMKKIPVSDDLGKMWNDKSTARDIAIVLDSALKSSDPDITREVVAWISWRLVAGSVVAKRYNSPSDSISIREVYSYLSDSVRNECFTRHLIHFIVTWLMEDSLRRSFF